MEHIELDAHNRVVVTIINHGPGLLHKVRYNREGERVIRLNVEGDSKKAASVPIADVDPKYTLSIKGTPVSYLTDVLLFQPARVMAVIDADDVVAEPDKRNNKKRESLIPRTSSLPTSEPEKRVKRASEGSSPETLGSTQSGSGNLDLAVTDIFLDNRRRVAVRVENHGGRLSPDLYRADLPGQIHLLINNRSWAYVYPLGPLILRAGSSSLAEASFGPAITSYAKQPRSQLWWTRETSFAKRISLTIL